MISTVCVQPEDLDMVEAAAAANQKAEEDAKKHTKHFNTHNYNILNLRISIIFYMF